MSKKLRILTWPGIWQRALDEAVSKPFTKEIGIPVEYFVHPDLELPFELKIALKQKKKIPVDVVFCNATAAFKAAKNDCCLLLDEIIIPNINQTIPSARLFENKACFAIAVYSVIYCLVYRKDLFNYVPDSWKVFLEERFLKKVAFYPGGKGFFPIAQVMCGGKLNDIPRDMISCWNFIKRIKHQIGSFSFTVPLLELFKEKKIDLAFRTLCDAKFLTENDSSLEISFPKEGVSDGADVFWIPKDLPEENISYAKEFINFSLREEIQKKWSEKLASVPVHTNLQNFDNNLKILHISEMTEMENEEKWQQKFDQFFL